MRLQYESANNNATNDDLDARWHSATVHLARKNKMHITGKPDGKTKICISHVKSQNRRLGGKIAVCVCSGKVEKIEKPQTSEQDGKAKHRSVTPLA